MRVAILVAFLLAAPAFALFAQSQPHGHGPVYACPMHPEVRSGERGVCPKCGMELLETEEPETVQIPHTRLGSGTSWQPDATPLRAVHLRASDWMLMLHGAATFGFDDQLGIRGGREAVSTNWFMGMASHAMAGGDVQLRAMLSLEPATVRGSGFPLLLQTGEFYQGAHLHDRQHPHDLFMEASVTYRRPLSNGLGIEVYLAPVGEPALGPTAFMHRASALGDPFPPISHHWQDATHVSFGVATAGVYTHDLKLEGSWFNGREPDENRWNFDFRPFDSFAVRLSANPLRSVSLQVSYGYLASPEPPGFAGVVLGVSRVTGSLTTSMPVLSAGHLDATFAWGRNLEVTPLDSFLFEANLDLDGKNAPFLRLEHVEKTAHDLVVTGVPTFQSYALSSAVVGFVHAFRSFGPIEPAIGARISLGLVPGELVSLYGSRAVGGGFIYLLGRIPTLVQ
jgi:hypothetical protein